MPTPTSHLSQITGNARPEHDRQAATTLALDQLQSPLRHLPQIARSFATIFDNLVATSASQFLATPVRVLPSGDEAGVFVAVDFGGSNLRVGVVRLGGGGARIVVQESRGVPDRLKSGTAEAVFGWVAERIGVVVAGYLARMPDGTEREEVMREGMEVGITFSFPVEYDAQTTHDSAVLMPTGKGFTLTGTNDLSVLFKTAYSALRSTSSLPDLRIICITNDSISTLLSAAYLHHASSATNSRAAAGIIAGTGTNATCLCPTSKLPTSKQPPSTITTSTTTLLNTEWSINGTSPPLDPYQTRWDAILDRNNEKPGFQPLEQMIGGRYLGELVRLICLDVLSPQVPEKLTTPYALDTKLCSRLEAAGDDEEILELLKDYFGTDEDDDDEEGRWSWDAASAATFRRVAVAVSTRAAALLAAATVGLLCLNDELDVGSQDGGEVVVCYAGTVLERYPNFQERCEAFMNGIVKSWRDAGGKEGRTVRLVEARDGGLLGAAVLAGMVKGGRT